MATWLCGGLPYTCDGFDPADWEGVPPVEFWRVRYLLSGAAQHTYTAACDGHHAPGPCPAAVATASLPKRPTEE